jgi:hypothetical protein
MLQPDLAIGMHSTGVTNGGSYTPSIIIRYAEVLLTLAEAAVETGQDQALAVECIKDIRSRAGSKKAITAVTLNDVRRERSMELYAEGFTFWDKVRWRTFHTEVNGRPWEVLLPIYVWDSKSYWFRRLNTGSPEVASKTFTFDPISYYGAIPDGEITLNDLLIQNPGY